MNFGCSEGGVLSARGSILFAVNEWKGLCSLSLFLFEIPALEGESLSALQPVLQLLLLVCKGRREDILVTLLLASLLILLPPNIRRI